MAAETEKKKLNIFSRLEKFSIPAILILTFAIGGVYAVNKQTIELHSKEINTLKKGVKASVTKINEIEKVPIKYDEQINNLSKQQDITIQSVRDLRLSIERTNELIIRVLDRQK